MCNSFLLAENPLYVMVYSDQEEVHLWNWNVQVYALIGGECYRSWRGLLVVVSIGLVYNVELTLNKY